MSNETKISMSKAWECFRVAPFAETHLVLASYFFYCNSGFNNSTETIYALLSGSIFLACAGAVREQFKLKKSLEECINEHGFQVDDFKRTVGAWCNRQTARVVSQKHGVLEEYEKVCETYKSVMRLKHLPHF